MRRLVLLLAVLLPALALAGDVNDAAWPRVTILPGTPAPTIDGTLSPGEWEGAVSLTGFTVLGRPDLTARQPQVWLAYTPQALLVAARVPSPPGQKARAAATDFDGTVWADDSLEIHLDRGHKHKQNYQFIVNALGTRFDSLAGDAKYNATWEAKAGNNPGQWTVEVAIPWTALGGGPAAGEVDGFNLIVNSSYLGGTLTYAPLKHSAHETASYAHLVYGTAFAVGLEKLTAEAGEVVLRGLGAGEGAAELALTRDGTALGTQSGKVGAGGTVSLPLLIPRQEGLPQPGQYALALCVRGAAGVVLSRGVTVNIGRPLEIVLNAFTKEGHLDVSVRPQAAVLPPADTDFELTVTGPGGVVKQCRVQAAGDAKPDLRLAAAELPAGKLTFSVVATSRKTGQRYACEKVVQDPLRPVWLGTKEGLTDKVPAPWTALVVDRAGAAAAKLSALVRCWGRSYGFSRGPLPAAVSTRGAAVLARPITLTGSVNGRPLDWTSGSCSKRRAAAGQVVLEGTAAGAGLQLRGTALIEYDGMVRVDLSLTPPSGGAVVKDLALQIPLKTAHARYLYRFPGRWGSVENSSLVPQGGWSDGFRPYLWLGDEDRGFSWCCESDRNWYPLDNKRALSVQVEGGTTYLRCHLIAGELKVDGPLEYTFGFQATPVKQPEQTVWDYRITHHGGYGLESQRSVSGGLVRYPARGHLRKEEGTFECWYRPAVDSETTVPFAQRTYQGNRSIFTVNWSAGMNGTNAGLYWNGTQQGLVGWSRTNGVVTDNPGTNFAWQAGEWHHIALTWGKQIRIYLDGKLISETPNKGYFGGPLEEATIEIGGDGGLATIDEVRILSVARAPVVSDKPLEADAETLLLDHFDDYGGGGRKDGAPQGTADAWLKFVPGRFGLAPTWEPQFGQTRLAQLAAAGVRTVCFHEHWVPYQSYPHVTEQDRPRLRSLADGLHAARLKLLLYMSRQFADNAPEWELYNAEACTEPRPAPYTRQPAQKAYLACWNGPYRDFALYWLGKTMDEFGNDGWYLDGPEWPMPCANRAHGCGYLAPDGTVRPTWDIFATREFMRRLYVLTRQRKPQGQLNIHNSTVMVTPTLGWGTSTWGGEQIDAIKPPVKTLDILPMDAFRTEFMGRQWGLPAEFLVYDGMPYYAKDVLAYTLLHGVLIRPGAPDALERTSALWKVHDEFPFSHGELLGYWNNGDYVKVEPQGVYASIWRLGKGAGPSRDAAPVPSAPSGALVVVSNLTDTDASATVRLNLGRLASGRRLTDALTGEPLAHRDGVLTLAVPAWRYRLLRVRP